MGDFAYACREAEFDVAYKYVEKYSKRGWNYDEQQCLLSSILLQVKFLDEINCFGKFFPSLKRILGTFKRPINLALSQ